jgi:hypothetical protein
MAIIQKTKSEVYELSELQAEINSNANIVPSCLNIVGKGQDLTLEFAAALSGAEDTELDTVISNHIPNPQIIDVVQLPFSGLDNKKLAVHPSYKPQIDGLTTFAVWTGAGDEVDGNGDLVDDGEIGGGPLLHLNCGTGVSERSIDVKFHPDNGRVWLHEAYIKFANAPEKCYISGGIGAMPTPLQQSVNLDLEVTGDWIHLAAGGPGTGSDGWADATKIVLIPRSFSKDGDWDYDGVNLIPNTGGTGGYKISNVEQTVHRFVNHIPVFDSCPYFSITSDETTELPVNYFVRVTAKTTDGANFTSAWHASVIMEIYRERTFTP